ncbi:AsnC family transcriptional regulator [Arthrobacter sp. MYb227]|uniref:Lrp/AsnC family transcriptional regulator n=1 Tax=Arthrobacter sp. MYb227 TaxID=1848601 RepID=UPI000CFAB466|nr:Lrp/AsnC family transcriptional regulator [Arthrobacter sp. MYb227]PQZ93064.1 AsnC family transcriptional regulator [Arthrobacter sp. MYb227]
MQQLDVTDIRILQALSAAPKASAVAIAAELGLSRNTVQSRMARLDLSGALLPFEQRINPAFLGFPLASFVNIHIQQRKLGAIVAKLRLIPEIIEAHGVTGSADILARVVASGAEELFRVNGAILDIDGVERADTSLSMAELIPRRTSTLMAQRLASTQGSPALATAVSHEAH